jgi:hypothetical protein
MARHFVGVCAALVLANSVASAAPVFVFDSFGPGDTYNGPPGITAGCGALCWQDEGHTTAWSFVAPETVRLHGVQTAAWQIFGEAVTLVVSIARNDLGLPGAVLESFSSPVSTPASLGFTSVDHPILQAGQIYWFIAATQDPVNDAAQIGISPIVVSGFESYRIGNGPWIGPFASGIPPSGYSVFRVTGEVVREPYTSSLVAFGVCLFMWLRRRRDNGMCRDR